MNDVVESKITFGGGWLENTNITRKYGLNTVEIFIKALYESNLPNDGTIGYLPIELNPKYEVSIPIIMMDAGSGRYNAAANIKPNGTITYGYSGSNARWVVFHHIYKL